MDNQYNNEGYSYLDFFSEHTPPVFGKYRRGPTPFNVGTYFTIIANPPRPLTEMLAVWLEDYSERYPREWIETQQQICIQGGPILELSHQPLPWIEVYLSYWSGNHWDGTRGEKEWIFFRSLVRCHLAKKHLQKATCLTVPGTTQARRIPGVYPSQAFSVYSHQNFKQIIVLRFLSLGVPSWCYRLLQQYPGT